MPPIKYAYVTILSDSYIKGALALNQSITMKCQQPLLVLCYDVSKDNLELLEKNGIEYRVVDMITSPFESVKYRGTYSKLHAFNLTEYAKVIFLDSDTLVVKSLDELFTQSITFGATTLKGVDIIEDQFSPGLMVIQPNGELFKKLMVEKDFVPSYDGGDQGFLNKSFHGNWVRIPDEYHVTKRIFKHHPDMWNKLVDNMRVLHFPGSKPWDDDKSLIPFEQGYEFLTNVWRKVYEKVEHKA